MAKQKPASPKQSAADTDTQKRPTQVAFEPMTKEQLWGGVGIVFFCLVGVAFGLGAWLDPSIAATLDSADRPGQLSSWVLPLIFPLLIPISLYFAWVTWKQWRETRLFQRHKQIMTGTITHLWFDRPSGRGKQHYVGYGFGEGHEAYQKIHSRTHGRLAIGEAVTVEYLPDNPRLSRVDLSKRGKKRQGTENI